MWVFSWKVSRLKVAETIFLSIHFSLKAETGTEIGSDYVRELLDVTSRFRN